MKTGSLNSFLKGVDYDKDALTFEVLSTPTNGTFTFLNASSGDTIRAHSGFSGTVSSHTKQRSFR
jgi:hypothetical protein